MQICSTIYIFWAEGKLGFLLNCQIRLGSRRGLLSVSSEAVSGLSGEEIDDGLVMSGLSGAGIGDGLVMSAVAHPGGEVCTFVRECVGGREGHQVGHAFVIPNLVHSQPAVFFYLPCNKEIDKKKCTSSRITVVMRDSLSSDSGDLS